MAENGKKTYQIVINGVQESTDAIKGLITSLDNLETRIDELKAKASVNVDVNVSDNTSDSKSSVLKEQDNLEKQILATEQKLSDVRSENYKKLLHMKEELKEYTQIAKSNVAATENAQGVYDTNTMLGMKSTLKNIKQEMQTLDVSSDRFKELTIQANELNNKLKSIEQSYGQFGRNVGNYANGVSDGIKKLNIDIGGIAQEFDNAKQALMALKKEMQTLSVKKDLGIISDEETERLKSLIPIVAQLESSIKDAGKPMDALLDAMQSFVAIASTAKGISAIFGFDNDKIEETIQKLVALQNVLQGIQTIQNQIKSQEGIGMIIARGNGAIDKMVKSILGVSTATKSATVATKALSVALKGIGWGVAVAAVSALVTWIGKFIDKQKKAREESEKTKKVEEDAAIAYEMAKRELSAYKNIVDNFNGTKKEEDNLVKELNKKYGSALGTYKSLAEWKTILTTKTEEYCKALMMEVELQAAADKYKEALQNQRDADNYEVGFWENIFEGSAAVRTRVKAMADQEVKEAADAYESAIKKYQGQIQNSKLFDYAPSIKESGKKAKKAVSDIEGEINRIRIESMREGLNKTILQLEEEKRQRINKIKANGQMVAELTKATEALYKTKIEDARKEYAKKFEDAERQMWEEIGKIGSDAAAKTSENILKASENSLDRGVERLQNKLKKIYVDYAPNYENVSDANRSKAGNFEAKVRQGELYAPDGTKINEDTLNALKAYQDIIEAIDATEGRIYMLQRSRQENGDTKIYDEEALSAAEDSIKSLREELEKLIKIQNEGKNIDYEAGFNALYGNDIEEFKRQLALKIQAEKDAANESYQIEKKRIQDEAQLREDQYAKEKYEELNGLESQKKYELKVLENQLKLEEISISKFREETANTEAKYAQLAMDTEIKYGIEIEEFTEKMHKQLQELEEKHKQELLDIDKRYEGDADNQRKAAFDKYADDLNKYYAEVAQKIEAANAEIAKLEASKEEIQSNPIGVSRDEIADEIIANYKKDLEVLKREKEAFLEYIGYTEEEVERSLELDALRNENYTSNLSEQFDARLGNHIKYYDDVEKAEKKHWDIVLEEQKRAISAQTESEKKAAEDRLSGLTESLKEQEELELNSVETEKEKNEIREKFRKQREAAEKTTQDHIKQLDEQFKNDIERAEIEHQNNIKATVTKTQQSIIGEYRDFYSKLSNLQSSLPITNDWGIINIKETKKRNKELIEGYTSLGQSIVNQKNELQKKLDDNEITFDEFTQARRELNDLQTSAAAALENVERDSKDLFGKFIGSIEQYIQAIGQGLQNLLSTVWDAEDAEYDKRMEELDKFIDEYEDRLDKQKEITQQHANEIDSIEDALSTARGDRRQALIDKLNAEMAAQRESLAQEKRIEKEKKKLEVKAEKEALKQKEKERDRALIQAAINVALGVTQALGAYPPPASYIMAAIVGALGAVQIGIIASQKYAEGGLLQGKSHREGGVKVLGGQAELEGGEFITNKVTTSKNVDLLDYINGKKRKLNIEDFIDFYGSNKVKNAVQTPRRIFAEGGQLPTLRNDISVGNTIANALTEYNNRPVVVSVVDIVNRTERLNQVKVMSGLED